MSFRQLAWLTSQIILATLLAGGAANAQGAATATSATSSSASSSSAGGTSASDALAALTGSANADQGDQANAAAPPPFQWNGAIDLNETYTSNANGGSGDPSDFYTRAGLQLGARYNTRRIQFFANYGLYGSYYARFHSLNQYNNNLNLAASAQIIPDQLIINVNAFATPTLQTRVGAISAGGEQLASNNTNDTYGYTVSPEYLVHFRDFATSITTVSQGGIYFVNPTATTGVSNASNSVTDKLLQLFNNIGTPQPLFVGVQNATTISGSERLQSGDYFGRFMWAFTGSYVKQTQASLSDTQEEGTGDFAYAVNHTFSLLATGGYDRFTSTVPLSKDLSGPIALGGFSYAPSPSFKLVAQAGVRDQFPNYTGSLHWAVTAMSAIDGQLTDNVTTPQSGILNSLSGLGGSLLNSANSSPLLSASTGAGLNPQLSTISPTNPQGLALQNAINHDRNLILTLSHTEERTNYSLALNGETLDQLNPIQGLNPKSSLYGITASASRQMRTDLNGYASASYSFADEFNGHDKIFTASIGAQYNITDTIGAYVQARFLHRDLNNITGVANVPLSDEELTVGIRRSF